MSTPSTWLEFEKPLLELERRIQDLRDFQTEEPRAEFEKEIAELEKKAEKLRREIYKNLTRWQKVQLARHPRRPYTLDYVARIAEDFKELHGDRGFADDAAIVGGIAKIDELEVMLIGHQKGRNTKDNIFRNFGMAHPEGYRKALRLMQLAGRYHAPIVTLIDTPGAYPGIGAEERGQSEAIARNLRDMSRIPVPIVAVVIGEGGSGGALALAVADAVLMLEDSIYSVISPEACSAILWGDRSKAPEAADALRLTANDLAELGVIDEIVPEPLGGAHRDPDAMAATLKEAILRNLAALQEIEVADLLARREQKFRRMGAYLEEKIPAQARGDFPRSEASG